MHDRPSAEFQEGASCIGTKTSDWCGASKGLGLARCVLAKCFLGKGIKLPRFSVSFDLAVPNLPVKLQEPLSKLRQLLRREFLDLAFNSPDLAHFTYLRVSIPPAHPVRLNRAVQRRAVPTSYGFPNNAGAGVLLRLSGGAMRRPLQPVAHIRRS